MYAKPEEYVLSWSRLVRGEEPLPSTALNPSVAVLKSMISKHFSPYFDENFTPDSRFDWTQVSYAGVKDFVYGVEDSFLKEFTSYFYADIVNYAKSLKKSIRIPTRIGMDLNIEDIPYHEFTEKIRVGNIKKLKSIFKIYININFMPPYCTGTWRWRHISIYELIALMEKLTNGVPQALAWVHLLLGLRSTNGHRYERLLITCSKKRYSNEVDTVAPLVKALIDKASY
jgi:hypothetical protein